MAGIRGHGGTSLTAVPSYFRPTLNFRLLPCRNDTQPFESDFQEGMNSEPGQPNQSSHGGGLEQFITGRAEEL